MFKLRNPLVLGCAQGILRTIALSGVPDGGFDAAELLRLSLDAAAAAPATDDPLVLECAHLVVEVRWRQLFCTSS